jgi:hypothetical protein
MHRRRQCLIARLSPAAVRARERRARQRRGIDRILHVKLPTRRLIVALRAANPAVGDLDTRTAIEAELQSVVEAFIERWVGPAKK